MVDIVTSWNGFSAGQAFVISKKKKSFFPQHKIHHCDEGSSCACPCPEGICGVERQLKWTLTSAKMEINSRFWALAILSPGRKP